MANDDRYGSRDTYRERDQQGWRSGDSDRGDSRGFFERAGERVESWFGGDDDRSRDRDNHRQPYGSHDRYGERSERSYGNRDQDRGGRAYGDRSGGEGYGYGAGASGGDQGNYGGYGASGDEGMRSGGGRYGASTSNPDALFGGLGVAPEFSDGPRFDRQDIGSTGTHGVHPVSSRFGEAQRDPMGTAGGGGSSARARAILEQAEHQGGRGRVEPGMQNRQQLYGSGQGGGRSAHDPHYAQWRQRQIDEIDRDYDEYRRENASRFESEFGSWREKRGQQRQSLGRVTEHMEVVGSDGQHVGTVDKVRDDRIILTKNDPNAGGHHHSIPCGWIDRVEDKVTISKSAEEAMKAWRDEETSRALGEDRNSGSDGPHILDRSFSGTYRDDDR